jgi:hypothetical protein
MRGYPWPESGGIFTGEVPKGKHPKKPLRRPAPIVGKSCGWRFPHLQKNLFFASIVTTTNEERKRDLEGPAQLAAK